MIVVVVNQSSHETVGQLGEPTAEAFQFGLHLIHRMQHHLLLQQGPQYLRFLHYR